MTIVRHTEAERNLRRARVEAAKDALKRSSTLQGAHVVVSRRALKDYLRNLDLPRQPDDAAFAALTAAPFRAPPRSQQR